MKSCQYIDPAKSDNSGGMGGSTSRAKALEQVRQQGSSLKQMSGVTGCYPAGRVGLQ